MSSTPPSPLWAQCVDAADAFARPHLPAVPGDPGGPRWLPEAVVLLAAVIYHHARESGLPADRITPDRLLPTVLTPHEARAAVHAAPDGDIGAPERADLLAAPLPDLAEIQRTAADLLR